MCRAATAALLLMGCAATATRPTTPAADPAPRVAPPAAPAAAVSAPTRPEQAPPDAAPEPATARVARLFETGGTVTLREGPICHEWTIDPPDRAGHARLSRRNGSELVSFAVELRDERVIVSSPRLGRGDASEGVCRAELLIRSADRRSIELDRGRWYSTFGECLQGLSEGHPAGDFGECEGSHALLVETRGAPRDDAGGVALQRALAHGRRFFWLEQRRGDEPVCSSWRFRGSGGGARIEGELDGGWRESFGVLAIRATHIELSGPGFGEENGSGAIGLGTLWIEPIHVHGALLMVGPWSWFWSAEDCEAARAAGGPAAWLREHTATPTRTD